MSKLFAVLAAFALLSMIALPGSADAAQRAEGLKGPGDYEVSAQQKKRYVRRAYPRRYYGPGPYVPGPPLPLPPPPPPPFPLLPGPWW